MMPGIGFEEMVIFALLAIVVIGPKDMPLMMRKFGRFTGKMRAMAFEFKQGIDELGRQAELDELRKEVANLKAHTGLDDIKKEIEQESAGMRSDVNSAMTHPAIAAPAAATTPAEEPKPVAPYAGLSADHPGYDAGDDFRIDGAAPAPAANGHHVNGDHANGAPQIAAEPLQASEPHIIPDDEAPVRPAIKQDTPA
jgi:sec-independent protein translocase protein TatB